MNEQNQRINDALRGARRQELTTVASDRHKGLNADIRSKANIGVTVGGEQPQAQEQAQEQAGAFKVLDQQKSEQQAPRAPTGNAGNGAYVVAAKPQPTMNDLFRSAWRGKRTGVINRYSETGREIQ